MFNQSAFLDHQTASGNAFPRWKNGSKDNHVHLVRQYAHVKAVWEKTKLKHASATSSSCKVSVAETMEIQRYTRQTFLKDVVLQTALTGLHDIRKNVPYLPSSMAIAILLVL